MQRAAIFVRVSFASILARRRAKLTRFDLETELHRHLNLSRRRAKEQARNLAYGPCADGVSRSGELRVVERGEKLEFELVFETFAEARHLDEREVHVCLSRSPEDVAPGVAIGSRVVRRRGEGAQIEPAIDRRIVELARTYPVRAIGRAGQKQVLRLENTERQSRPQQQNPAQFPSADELVRGRRLYTWRYASFASFNNPATSLIPTPGPLGTDIFPSFTLIGESNQLPYFSVPSLYS